MFRHKPDSVFYFVQTLLKLGKREYGSNEQVFEGVFCGRRRSERSMLQSAASGISDFSTTLQTWNICRARVAQRLQLR